MPELGPAELIFILAFTVLIFGPSKLTDLASGLGKGLREFRRAIKEDDPSAPRDRAPAAPDAEACSSYGRKNPAEARFCMGWSDPDASASRLQGFRLLDGGQRFDLAHSMDKEQQADRSDN